MKELHDRLVKSVEAERNSHKNHSDYLNRLTRELTDYPSYVHPLAVLSIEIYNLDLPQLQSEDIQMHTSSHSNVLNRDYKRLLCGGKKKGQHAVFINAFISAFIKKFC